MSASEAQSKNVCEVLDSEIFKFWMPEQREYVEIEPNSQAVLIILLSLGTACLSGLFLPVTKDFLVFYERILVAAIFIFVVIVAIWAFGKGTIARYSRDELEVGDAKRVFFRIPWDEILEVQKVKRNGHRIITSQGTAVIAWPPLVLDKKGYAFFLRATLDAMATGNLRGDFYRIPMPVKLEEGHRYEYVNRRDTEQRMMIFLLWFVPITFVLSIYKAIQHHNFMDGLTSCSMWLMWFFALDKYRTLRRETRHVGIEVRDGRLHVTRPKSSVDVANQHADGKLVPCMNPTPLDGAERFGSGIETVRIDRRFLVDVTP